MNNIFLYYFFFAARPDQIFFEYDPGDFYSLRDFLLEWEDDRMLEYKSNYTISSFLNDHFFYK
ncbi:MAG: hypothetical protein CVT92_00025 [Bacteroidetes bacterium HGW-Bacteroidetes-1]|nr:MAG: hypothetical protein CVT92_00025 [Bacteroidetes bacterium HGW-Bacteroidetes-1]